MVLKLMLQLQQERDDRVSVLTMMTRRNWLLLHITYSQCCISITPYTLYSFYQLVSYSLHGVEVQILHGASIIECCHDTGLQSSAVATLGHS
jgi:hypothetical protein